MIKKYFDENNHLVGISYGEITSNNKDTDYDQAQQIMGLLETKPEKAGYKTYLLDSPEGGFINYDYEYEPIPASEWSDELVKEMLKDKIVNSITIGPKPRGSEKVGYTLKPKFDGTAIYWDFEENENTFEEQVEALGTYLSPYRYIQGMAVKAFYWYTDGDNVWEALKAGIPNDFNDREYFDIIG